MPQSINLGPIHDLKRLSFGEVQTCHLKVKRRGMMPIGAEIQCESVYFCFRSIYPPTLANFCRYLEGLSILRSWSPRLWLLKSAFFTDFFFGFCHGIPLLLMILPWGKYHRSEKSTICSGNHAVFHIFLCVYINKMWKRCKIMIIIHVPSCTHINIYQCV